VLEPVLDQDTTPPEAAQAYCDALVPFWHPVLRAQDLGDEPVRIVLLGRVLVLVKLDGVPRAFTNVCRHLGSSLALGSIIDGKTLRCRYHGWEYDGSGQCVRIPLRGDAEIPPQARVQTYACREQNGLIWVCLADEPAQEPFPFPQFTDDRFHKNAFVQHPDWEASVPRLVMAALDDTHFSWVHPGILGVEEQPIMPERLGPEPIHFEDGLMVSRYRTRLPVSPLVGAGSSDETEPAEFTNYVAVNGVANVVDSPAGTSVTWNCFMPITHARTRTFTCLARDFDRDHAHDEQYETFNGLIKEQDREIVENQRPWLLPPLQAQLIMYVRPEDAPLVEYQKWLQRVGVPQI
jgi:vanillate O-demethylase monooxygenase subunit